MLKEELLTTEIDPNRLMDSLTVEEDSVDTFQPNKVFSDQTKCAPIERIVVSENDGVRVYLRGLKYPLQQYPHRPFVKNACVIKKTFLITMNFLASMAKPKDMIKLLIIKKNLKEFIPKLIVLFSYIIGSRRLQQKYYSHSVREIYRVFNLLIEREDPGKMRDTWKRIRDIICLILEFDNAYRVRAQDFLSELNMKKIKLTKEDLWYAEQTAYYSFGGRPRMKKKDKVI